MKRNVGRSSPRVPVWAVLGGLLLLAGMALVAWNERRVMAYDADASAHGGGVLDLGAEGHPSSGQYGTLTRVSGTPSVSDAPVDREFNVRAQSPLLVRHVDMFQWREITVGGSTHYEMDWVDHPVDASGFAKPAGHVNPGSFPVQGREFEAGEVRLGNFRLSPEVLRAFPGRVPVPVTMKTLPANLAATFQAVDGALVTSAHVEHPRLGDLRVRWEAVPLQTMTVLARIDGDTLVPGQPTERNEPGFEVQTGDRTLMDVLPALPEAPAGVPLVRLLACVAAVCGAWALARGTRMHNDVLFALAVGGLVVAAVGGATWLIRDAMAASVWFLLAVLGVGLAVWRVQRRTAAAS